MDEGANLQIRSRLGDLTDLVVLSVRNTASVAGGQGGSEVRGLDEGGGLLGRCLHTGVGRF